MNFCLPLNNTRTTGKKINQQINSSENTQAPRKEEDGKKNVDGSVGGSLYLSRFENANNVERRGEKAAA